MPSTKIKRALRRKYYDENKSKALFDSKESYRLNPDRKKNTSRTYSKRRYTIDPGSKRAASKRRYTIDPGSKRAASKRRYNIDPGSKRAASKRRYTIDPGSKRAASKRRYNIDRAVRGQPPNGGIT